MSTMIDAIYAQKRKRWGLLKKTRMNSNSENVKCSSCETTFSLNDVKENLFVCPECGNYMVLSPSDRIELVCDAQSFKEMYKNLKTKDPISFPEYDKKLKVNQAKTRQWDAFVTGTATISKMKVAIGVLDSRFLMGSMGTVVGEKIASITEYAMKKKLPLIIFSASGGARMQEGLFSLMQMAKTSAAVEKFKNAGGLFISCLTNPTTGGVSASYASLGDIIIAEPGALVGFAGPRVIEQTIGQKLPEGFQRSEFLLEHGMIDMIVPRKNMKATLTNILRLHGGEKHEK